MHLYNHGGRLAVAVDGALVDVHTGSGGAHGPDPHAVLDDWSAFCAWARRLDAVGPATVDATGLDAPAPRPRQVFAIGLNYGDHADEAGFRPPDTPVVFTKFASAITGPQGDIALPEGDVDWEVELVAVIGRGGRDISEARAWSHVAGLTVGQDLSERVGQMAGPAPQFSLAKSHDGFAPMGPALVTVDELDDPDDLTIECRIDGEVVQSARTSDMIFPVPELVARLSRVVELLPGDVVFTGTPPGVGFGRTPARFLQDGEELVSTVGGVGTMRHRLRRSGAQDPGR
jgi:2,4-diketo-3-deoxy-L-fuconate hydrolase